MRKNTHWIRAMWNGEYNKQLFWWVSKGFVGFLCMLNIYHMQCIYIWSAYLACQLFPITLKIKFSLYRKPYFNDANDEYAPNSNWISCFIRIDMPWVWVKWRINCALFICVYTRSPLFSPPLCIFHYSSPYSFSLALFHSRGAIFLSGRMSVRAYETQYKLQFHGKHKLEIENQPNAT